MTARALGVLLLISLIGCGAEETVYDPDSFATDYAAAFCDTLERCALFADPGWSREYDDVASCRAVERAYAIESTEPSVDGCAFSSDAADRCIAAQLDTTCDTPMAEACVSYEIMGCNPP